MSKKGYISRYLLILKKLKIKKHTSYQDLQKYINNELEHLKMWDDTLEIAFSQRTLQRDIKEIRNLFGIDIEFSRSHKGYYILQDESENMNFQRMMEAFDTFSSLNMAKDLQPFIHLEQRRPQGTENMYGLLHAIKNNLNIRYAYHKFWEDGPTQRLVAPFALKEFNNRWYLVAKDIKTENIRTFALDRLSELEITKQKFNYPLDFNVEEMFKNSFGIITPEDGQVEEVVLSFSPFQGKYIKTLPLHHSQQILMDNEQECIIGLKVKLTFDFEQEILSHGACVKVISPQRLVDSIKNSIKDTLAKYE